VTVAWPPGAAEPASAAAAHAASTAATHHLRSP
jgi:hypothetical protein